MTTEPFTSDPFEHDDAAYVLGALSDEERAAFEAHLEECDACARRVAELRPMTGALAVLDEADFAELSDLAHADLATDPVPDTLLPALLREVRREQRRRHRVIGALVGVAAACVLALTAVVAWPSTHHNTGHPLAMHALTATPVQASATLTSLQWGTRIVLSCHYEQSYASPYDYTLLVVDKQGVAHQAGSWQLPSDNVTTFVSGTALSRDQISKIEITAGTTPILQLDL